MTDREEQHRYWRSKAGRQAFAPLHEAGFQRVFGRAPRAEVPTVFGGIRAYDDFPDPGLVTYATHGLGFFILSDVPGSACGGRIELTWTVVDSVPFDAASRVIDHFADAVLESHVLPEADVVFRQFSQMLAESGFSTPALLLGRRLWLDPDAFEVENFYPLFFLEIIALPEAAAARAEAGIDAFYEWAETTEFDATDPMVPPR